MQIHIFLLRKILEAFSRFVKSVTHKGTVQCSWLICCARWHLPLSIKGFLFLEPWMYFCVVVDVTLLIGAIENALDSFSLLWFLFPDFWFRRVCAPYLYLAMKWKCNLILSMKFWVSCFLGKLTSVWAGEKISRTRDTSSSRCLIHLVNHCIRSACMPLQIPWCWCRWNWPFT